MFSRDWVYAGHISQIPEVGNYFTYELAYESIIVVRAGEDEVLALVNVCRHRGSRVCDPGSGRARQFVCPYHGWVYRLDGSLRSARLFPDDLDLDEFSLHRISLRTLHGLIFVSLAANPESFDPVEQGLSHCLAAFGLGNARVAAHITYPVVANWKLTLENYLECYHCAPAHPEFSESHTNKFARGTYPALERSMVQKAQAAGLCCDDVDAVFPALPAISYSHDRFALFEGYETGSRDGSPLAPLMGTIGAFDGGASNAQVGSRCFLLCYCDHTVVYRFTPREVDQTDMEIIWLVDGAAVEGEDYDQDNLVWLWDVTSIADKTIIERNHSGVRSSFYRPGPYAPLEDWVLRFRDWYLDTMSCSSD